MHRFLCSLCSPSITLDFSRLLICLAGDEYDQDQPLTFRTNLKNKRVTLCDSNVDSVGCVCHALPAMAR